MHSKRVLSLLLALIMTFALAVPTSASADLNANSAAEQRENLPEETSLDTTTDESPAIVEEPVDETDTPEENISDSVENQIDEPTDISGDDTYDSAEETPSTDGTINISAPIVPLQSFYAVNQEEYNVRVNFPGISDVYIQSYVNGVWGMKSGPYNDYADIYLDNGALIDVSQGGMYYRFSYVETNPDNITVLDIPTRVISVTGINVKCTLGLVKSDWVYRPASYNAGDVVEFTVFDGIGGYVLRVTPEGYHEISLDVNPGDVVNLSDNFFTFTVPEGVSNLRIWQGNWIVYDAQAGQVITLMKSGAAANMSFVYDGKVCETTCTLDGKNPFDGLTLVNFSGLSNVYLQYYITSWTDKQGPYEDWAFVRLQNNCTLRILRDGMTWTNKVTVIPGIVNVVDIPVSTITVTGLKLACNVGLAQGDWIYRTQAYQAGDMITYAIIDNGNAYKLHVTPSGYNQFILEVKAGDTVDLSSYFYDITIPEGLTDVYLSQGNWIASNAKGGDVITLLRNDKDAVLKYKFKGVNYNETIVLNGTNPFDGLTYVRFEGLDDIYLQHYITSWSDKIGPYKDWVLIKLPMNTKNLRAAKGGMTYSTAVTLKAGIINEISVPYSTITVTGIPIACEIGLSQGSWIYNYAAYTPGEPVVYALFDNGKAYSVNIKAAGYGKALAIEVKAGDTVDVSEYFYKLTVPTDFTNVYISQGNWIVSNKQPGDTFTLIKTDAEGAIKFNYKGEAFQRVYFLDGSNPFVVLNPLEAAIAKAEAILKDDYKYTNASVAALRQELDSAYELLKSEGLTQDMVVAAAEALLATIDGMILKNTVTMVLYDHDAYEVLARQLGEDEEMDLSLVPRFDDSTVFYYETGEELRIIADVFYGDRLLISTFTEPANSLFDDVLLTMEYIEGEGWTWIVYGTMPDQDIEIWAGYANLPTEESLQSLRDLLVEAKDIDPEDWEEQPMSEAAPDMTILEYAIIYGEAVLESPVTQKIVDDAIADLQAALDALVWRARVTMYFYDWDAYVELSAEYGDDIVPTEEYTQLATPVKYFIKAGESFDITAPQHLTENDWIITAFSVPQQTESDYNFDVSYLPLADGGFTQYIYGVMPDVDNLEFWCGYALIPDFTELEALLDEARKINQDDYYELPMSEIYPIMNVLDFAIFYAEAILESPTDRYDVAQACEWLREAMDMLEWKTRVTMYFFDWDAYVKLSAEYGDDIVPTEEYVQLTTPVKYFIKAGEAFDITAPWTTTDGGNWFITGFALPDGGADLDNIFAYTTLRNEDGNWTGRIYGNMPEEDVEFWCGYALVPDFTELEALLDEARQINLDDYYDLPMSEIFPTMNVLDFAIFYAEAILESPCDRDDVAQACEWLREAMDMLEWKTRVTMHFFDYDAYEELSDSWEGEDPIPTDMLEQIAEAKTIFVPAGEKFEIAAPWTTTDGDNWFAMGFAIPDGGADLDGIFAYTTVKDENGNWTGCIYGNMPDEDVEFWCGYALVPDFTELEKLVEKAKGLDLTKYEPLPPSDIVPDWTVLEFALFYAEGVLEGGSTHSMMNKAIEYLKNALGMLELKGIYNFAKFLEAYNNANDGDVLEIVCDITDWGMVNGTSSVFVLNASNAKNITIKSSEEGVPRKLSTNNNYQRHLWFSNGVNVEWTFEDIILDGQDKNGGILIGYSGGGANVTINGLVIQNCRKTYGQGLGSGAGISVMYSNNNVTLNDVTVQNCHGYATSNASSNGGGISITSTSVMTLNNCYVQNNYFYNTYQNVDTTPTVQNNGGGIYNNGILYLNNTMITGNKAYNGAGVFSDGVYDTNCAVYIGEGTVISGNTSNSARSAVHLKDKSRVFVQDGAVVKGNLGGTDFYGIAMMSNYFNYLYIDFGSEAGTTSNYENPVYNNNLTVFFEVECSVDGGNGTVDANAVTVNDKLYGVRGKTLTFTATPDEKYLVEGWTVNGEFTESDKETLEVDVTGLLSVQVSFVKDTGINTFAKFKAAYAAAKDGDTILISEDITDWNEIFFLESKNVTIKSDDPNVQRRFIVAPDFNNLHMAATSPEPFTVTFENIVLDGQGRSGGYRNGWVAGLTNNTVDVTIIGLAFDNCWNSGAISNTAKSTLNLQNVRIENCGTKSTGQRSGGGGISNASNCTLILDNVQILNCKTIITNLNQSAGGGIRNTGFVSMTNTLISGNDAYYGGGIHNENGGNLELGAGVVITNNTATYGGGIYTMYVGNTYTHYIYLLDGVSITGNTAVNGSGIRANGVKNNFFVDKGAEVDSFEGDGTVHYQVEYEVVGGNGTLESNAIQDHDKFYGVMGKTLTFTAIPNEKYLVAGWTVNGEFTESDKETLEVNVAGSLSVQVSFAEDTGINTFAKFMKAYNALPSEGGVIEITGDITDWNMIDGKSDILVIKAGHPKNVTIKSSEPGVTRTISVASSLNQRHLWFTGGCDVTWTFEDIIMDGQDANGGVYINGGSTVTLNGLVLQNCRKTSGQGVGGVGGIAIAEAGNYVTLNGVTVKECFIYSSNLSSLGTAGIGNPHNSTLIMDNCQVLDNYCLNIFNGVDRTDEVTTTGAGIQNAGILRITNTTISGNKSQQGAGIYCAGTNGNCYVYLGENVNVTGNISKDNNGAVYVYNGAKVFLEDGSAVSGNIGGKDLYATGSSSAAYINEGAVVGTISDSSISSGYVWREAIFGIAKGKGTISSTASYIDYVDRYYSRQGRDVSFTVAPDRGQKVMSWSTSNGWVETADTTLTFLVTDRTAYARVFLDDAALMTVSFYDGTEKVGSLQVYEFEPIDYNFVPVIEREGHTFVFWALNADGTAPWDFAKDKVTKNISLYAVWDVNEYTATFNSDDEECGQYTVHYGQPVPMHNPPAKEGWTFLGWFTDNGEWDFDNDTMPAGNLILNAHWEINKYTVTFITDILDDVKSEVTVEHGEAVAKPEDPEMVGHTFLGWFTESADGVAWDFDTQITGDLILYAKWAVNSYTITFFLNGALFTDADVDYGQAVDRPEDPVKEGYTFDGWYADSEFAESWDFDTPITGDLSLFARWNINTYVVTFYALGEIIGTKGVAFGELISVPENAPQIEGWNFLGWFTDVEDVWNFSVDTMPAYDLTLTAIYEHVYYTVTFDSNGGSYVAPESVAYGNVVIRPQKPVLAGYVFDGWIAGNGSVYDFNNQVYADMTLRASWLPEISISNLEPARSGNQVSVSFACKSPSGKGYTLYYSQSGADGPYNVYTNVTYSAKGATIKGLNAGSAYWFYFKYDSGGIERSEVIYVKP